ncbi:helix-turn-helix domain-containing protein [Nocardioides seonyuensis]|uniref:Helix-turn-helix domain-containing protein n=1 Tax=Nocardioides seonyuensis TaxID=2518371 RepID=A0A4P7IJD4_9ACTN|nr:helix-turn-helix domain-containing protein [Nocardioides seonyuensis]
MLRVGVLLYDGCFAAEAMSVMDMLTVANRVAQFSGQPERFAVSAVGVDAGPVSTSGGTAIHARRISYALDLLVVPGFDFGPGQGGVPDDLACWRREVGVLRRASERGVPVASICVGAFLLGAAGLLDGRRATTAWLVADELARRHPLATVEAAAVLVEDGPVTTTGAFSASSDLALHLARLHAGPDIARATARLTLTRTDRSSQSPYVDESLARRSRGAFSTAVRAHLLDRIDEAYDLAALAAHFHVSTRTLLRRFRAETNQTPLDFIQSARIGRAKRLLETTDLGVAEVSAAVGYLDPASFRRLFASHVGMSPSHYRRSFSDVTGRNLVY